MFLQSLVYLSLFLMNFNLLLNGVHGLTKKLRRIEIDLRSVVG